METWAARLSDCQCTQATWSGISTTRISELSGPLRRKAAYGTLPPLARRPQSAMAPDKHGRRATCSCHQCEKNSLGKSVGIRGTRNFEDVPPQWRSWPDRSGI